MANQEKAEEIFAAHSQKHTLHFTSDGQPFFEENPARNHAAHLDDKELVTIHRGSTAVEIQEVDNEIEEQKKIEEEMKIKQQAELAVALEKEKADNDLKKKLEEESAAALAKAKADEAAKGKETPAA